MNIQRHIQARTDRNIISANYQREIRELKTAWVGKRDSEYYTQLTAIRIKYQSILNHLKNLYRIGIRDLYDIQSDLIDNWKEDKI